MKRAALIKGDIFLRTVYIGDTAKGLELEMCSSGREKQKHERVVGITTPKLTELINKAKEKIQYEQKEAIGVLDEVFKDYIIKI